jgi:ABC-2 type transport system ATP-binding protein
MSSPAITVEGLWKQFRMYHDKNRYLKTTILTGHRARYDEFWALQDISFEVPRGETFGIIGSNGSGKSTLLKCLTGIITPDRGSIKIDGRVAALLELGAGFHPDLSGRENIYLNGAILGMSAKEIEANLDNIVEFAELGEFIDSPVRTYSSGMTVRLAFSIAINVDPEILIIDEILAVGDLSFQQRCYERIETLRNDGRTILIVSHGLGDIARLCSNVAWIDKGHLRRLGTSYEITDEYIAQTHSGSVSLEVDQGERWGSGEAQINTIALFDERGAAATTIQTGHRLHIDVSYTNNASIEDLVIDVQINHLHGVLVWKSSSKESSQLLLSNQREGSARLEIPSLPLLEGTYLVTISLVDSTGVHEYDHWGKALRFDVHQNQIHDTGLIAIEAKWTNNHL